VAFHFTVVAQDGPCIISGRVIDQDTRELVPNATIRLNKIEVGVSDSTGHFLITGINAGKYQLSVKAERYSKKPYDSVLIQENSTNNFDVQVQRIPQCRLYHLNNIYFDSHSFIVNKKYCGAIDTVARILKFEEEEKEEFLIIEVDGHSETWECKKNDTALSYQRALEVADVLITYGIDPSQIKVRGYGGLHPIAPNSTKGKKDEEGSQLNRLVEFRIRSSRPY